MVAEEAALDDAAREGATRRRREHAVAAGARQAAFGGQRRREAQELIHMASEPGMIETRLLRQFIAVAEERISTARLSALHMAQPPLSQAIQRLEAQVGALAGAHQP